MSLSAFDPGNSGILVGETVSVQVVEPPSNVGPHVVITRPGPDKGFTTSQSEPLMGRVQDFDEAGDVQYEWIMRVGLSETTLNAGSMPNHDTTSVTWNVGSHFFHAPASPSQAAGKLPVGCGGETVEIELRGTDADNMTGYDTVWVRIPGPPC